MVQIWIPGSAKEVVDRCKIPTPDGPCGHAFYAGESDLKKAQHFKICAHEHMDGILEARQRQHPDVLKPWDPEYADWLDEHKAGIAAGTVKW